MSVRPDIKTLLAERLQRLAEVVGELDINSSETEDFAEGVLIRLESLYVDLIEIDLRGNDVHPLVLLKVFESWQLVKESVTPSLICYPGRPALDIPCSCIESLMELKFTSGEIACILSVSRSTICRRMRQYGLSYSRNYCCISDANLDELVRAISRQHPGCGSKMMEGHLRAQGITVQQTRIRESLRRTDPEGTAIRLRANIRRRVYDVTLPQSLWHIDGNHKLVRWRFVVHGGIDGFSRLPVYLRCSTTNTAEKVFEYFLDAVQRYGRPLRVRSDMGGENIRVAEYMWSHQHAGIGQGMIMGRSVHNQRIERLWRDVYQGCLSLYYNIFMHLENCGFLDPCNELHLFVLHYIYQSRIQQSLDCFQQAYINHPLSSCGNRTPAQLFVCGAIQYTRHCQLSQPSQDQGFPPVLSGIDLSAPLPTSFDDEIVVVPDITLPNSELCLQQLQRHSINPLHDDSNYGISLYLEALNLLV